MTTDDEILDRNESAGFLKISKKSLDRLQLPRIELGKRRVGFWKSTLIEYAKRRTIDAPSAAEEGSRSEGTA